MNKEEMIEEIKKMTVVELADLVKAIEEEFGVSAVAAAAPFVPASVFLSGFVLPPSASQRSLPSPQAESVQRNPIYSSF